MTSKLQIGTVDCVSGKRERFTWTMRLVDSSGVRCGLGASDKVKFRLASTQGSAASLAFDSTTASTNGSSMTISSRGSSSVDANGVLELRAADTLSLSGTMQFELDVIDAGDSNREAQPIRGALRFLPSMTG
jgi:hypothetical protein